MSSQPEDIEVITYAVRRTNPLSRWPWRIVRSRAFGPRIITHKLLRKFETYEAAQAYLTRYSDAGLIDRLA